jgi:hypothetical protein
LCGGDCWFLTLLCGCIPHAHGGDIDEALLEILEPCSCSWAAPPIAAAHVHAAAAQQIMFCAAVIHLRMTVVKHIQRYLWRLPSLILLSIPMHCCLVADDDNDAVLFEKIKSGNYDADDPIWENISIEAKDVVAKLLTVSAMILPHYITLHYLTSSKLHHITYFT